MQSPPSQLDPAGQLPFASQVPEQQMPRPLEPAQGPTPHVKQHVSVAQSWFTLQAPPFPAAEQAAAAARKRPRAAKRSVRIVG